MLTVAARELRANLRAHLRLAEAGEEILVTVNGVPRARLGPLGQAAALAELARAELAAADEAEWLAEIRAARARGAEFEDPWPQR